jgi:hypothetical protein
MSRSLPPAYPPQPTPAKQSDTAEGQQQRGAGRGRLHETVEKSFRSKPSRRRRPPFAAGIA